MEHVFRRGRATNLGRKLTLTTTLLWAGTLYSAQIVTDGPNTACVEYQLNHELRIYKDPTLFLSNLGLIQSDPSAGWDALAQENPLLTTVQGKFELMPLGAPQPFRNFGAIARLYEAIDARFREVARDFNPRASRKDRDRSQSKSPMILPVKVCGLNEAYTETLGFVLVDDLKEAQRAEHTAGSLPPSTYPNPIPIYHVR